MSQRDTVFGDLREEEDTVSGKGSAHTSGYPHTVGVVCVEDDLICYQRSKLKHVFRI
jgi:hypothetical protein